MATPAIVAALALWPGSAAAQAMPRGDHPMMGWGGMGWMGMLLWILVVAAVVLLVVALAKRIGGDARPPRRAPLEILEERLARGEIDIEEYEARKAALER